MITRQAYAPLDRFVCAEEGRRIRDRGQLVDGASFPVPVTLVLSVHEVSGVSEGDSLVLVDAEGAAVAEVDVDGLWDAGNGRVGVSGPVRGARAPAHSFAGLGHRACDVRDAFAASGSRGVLIARPLLAPEVSALAEIAEDGPVVLLTRSVDPLVPVDVLVKATGGSLVHPERDGRDGAVRTAPRGRRRRRAQRCCDAQLRSAPG